jgi:ribulose kinase
MVVADSKGNPLQISPNGIGENDGSAQQCRDIIMWMDHRAMVNDKSN